MRELDDNWLMMPIADAQIFYASSQLSMIGIQLKEGVDPEDFSSRLQRTLSEQRLNVDARPWQRHRLAEIYRTNMELLGILRNFILLTVIVVCAMSMLNSITRSIMERTREIGSLRAIGYEQGFIVAMFGFEGMFLGVLGSIFGVVLALLLTMGINLSGLMYLPPYNTSPLPFRLAFSIETYLGLAFLLTFCAGSIAAETWARVSGS